MLGNNIIMIQQSKAAINIKEYLNTSKKISISNECYCNVLIIRSHKTILMYW